VEPWFNEVPRDWGNWFVISRVRYTVEPWFNQVSRDWGNWFVISRVRYTVEPWFNEVPRDWGNWSVISRFFSMHWLLQGCKISFVIQRTSLYRGSLNRSSTVYSVTCFAMLSSVTLHVAGKTATCNSASRDKKKTLFLRDTGLHCSQFSQTLLMFPRVSPKN